MGRNTFYWDKWVRYLSQHYESKKYYHFDQPIGLPKAIQKVEKIIGNREGFLSHSFFPFIRREIKVRRFGFDKNEDKYHARYKIRPITYSGHLDSLIFSYYSFVLNSIYEEKLGFLGLNNSVVAYRTNLDGKCNVQFAKEVFDFIKNKRDCVVLAVDIKGYFDNIDHSMLKREWSKLLGIKSLPDDHYRIFKKVTKYSYVEYNELVKELGVNFGKVKHGKHRKTITDLIPGADFGEKMNFLRVNRLIKTNKLRGIPQGSPISSVLSNLFLLNVDQELNDLAKLRSGLYRRYCDDILFVSNVENWEEDYSQIISSIEQMDLKVSKNKTEMVLFKDIGKFGLRGYDLSKNPKFRSRDIQVYFKSLQYLGFEFNGKNIFIRSSSLARYFRKMKRRVLRSVLTAEGNKGWGSKVFRKQIYRRYTHFGTRNFISYALRASKKQYRNSRGQLKEGMGDKSIKRQVRRHFEHLENYIARKVDEISSKKK